MAQRFHCLAVSLVLIVGCSLATRADEADEPVPQATVDAMIKDLSQRYGVGAVSLQGYLLHHAIEAGSQLEVVVSISGIESHSGHDYLAYVIDSGIVYPDGEVSKQEQLGLIWRDVIDPSIRKAVLLTLPGEGLALRVRSYRGASADRIAIARAAEARQLAPVETVFVLPADSMRAFVDGTLSAREISTRGEVQLDGRQVALDIVPTPRATAAPPVTP